MNHSQGQYKGIILGLSLMTVSCVGNVQSPEPTYNQSLDGTLDVLQVGVERIRRGPDGKTLRDGSGKPIVDFFPISDQMTVHPDEEIRITFNRKIDSYSARPENFELFTDEGSRVPGNVTPNASFVNDPSGATNPDGSPVKVSQLKLRPPNRFFLPSRRYFLLWRAAPEAGSQADVELPGIRDESGKIPLTNGSTTFVTDTEFSDSSLANLKIRAMSPGRVISSASPGSATLRDVIGNYTTWVANSPIRILFTEPIRHLTESAQDVQRPEIPKTNLAAFNGLKLGVVGLTTLQGVNTKASDLINGALSGSAWTNFLQEHAYNQLQGTVHTENGRRVLVFELNSGATYPDDLAKAVIVIIQGFADLESYGTAIPKSLENNGIAVGAFIHFSGLKLPIGFDDPKKILRNFFNPGGQP